MATYRKALSQDEMKVLQDDFISLYGPEDFLAASIRLDSPIMGNLAWAAGFWDGEGHVSARDNSSGGRQIKASITQKYPDLLEQFQSVTGLGKIHPKRSQDFWAWHLARHGLVLELAEMLWPWLGAIKREQFIRAFGNYALLAKFSGRG